SPNAYSLTALQPATTTSNPSYSVSFAGSLQNQYDYQVDGLSFRGSFGGHGIQGNYNEWMEQQSTGYVNNGADYQSLAVVNVTSKSGTNAFHASGVDYYTSGGLQGRSPFTPARPSLVQNIFATSAGGPIRKDRTFFFAAFSGTRSPGVSAGNATVPTQAMTAGNFAGFAPVIDPGTGAAFPNNQIPASRISSVSSAFTQLFYPAPNFGGGAFLPGNYRFTVPTFNKETNLFGRVDQRFSDQHSMFVHYEFDHSPCGVRVCFTGSLPTVGYRLGYRRDQNSVLSDIYAFSPTVFNEFGLGWTRDLNYIVGQTDGTTLLQKLGLQGIAPLATPGITVMNIQGLTTVSQQSISKIPKELYTIRDNVNWTRGMHNMKFGFMAAQGRYYQLPNQPDPVFGSFSFTSALAGGAGNAFANFLLGIPTAENRQISFNAVYYRRNTYQFFAQDNIEVSRKLTINLGLRYEYYQPFEEIHGQSYTVNLQNGAIVLPNQQAFQLINPLILQSPSFPVQTAAQAGYPSSIYSLSEKNFAPRLGVAYRINEKTVARAGYGLFYDFIPPQPTATDLFIGNESFANNQIVKGVPNYQFPNPYVANPLPVGTLSVSSYAAHLRMPYTQQWNFTLERQLGAITSIRASYIGSHTIGQIYSAPANIPMPGTTPFAQSRRPLTQFGQITRYQSGANASYNALSLQLQHRARSGIYLNTSYTWAKHLGIGGEASSISGAESPVTLSPFNR
ncbi:MAG TPA: TonB-dependent receptor, partial [Bryobacteraceae bacterium]|nr:TonB-dependent receptor [Bryobacteraceae bacterium]